MKRTPMAGIDLPGNLPLAWEALAARDAEIERLRKLIDDAGKPWILLDPGVPWEGAIDAAMAAACGEIERLRALVEKRERQLVYCVRRGAWSQTDPEPFVRDVTTRPASHVRFGDDALSVEYDGTDDGLLAAIDEATEPR